MAMMTEVRIKGILVSSNVGGQSDCSALTCRLDFVGLRSWASRCDGETCSRTCMPAVDRIAVRCLIMVKTSSCVLYSSTAKFSAMYRVKSTSSCCSSNWRTDKQELKGTCEDWFEELSLKTLTSDLRKSCLVARFSRTSEYHRCNSETGVGCRRNPGKCQRVLYFLGMQVPCTPSAHIFFW